MRKSPIFIPVKHQSPALAHLKAFTRGEFSFTEGSSGWSQEVKADIILAASSLDSALSVFGCVRFDVSCNITALTLNEEIEPDDAADLARVLRPWVQVGSFLFHPQGYDRKTLLCGWYFDHEDIRFETGLVVPLSQLRRIQSLLHAQQRVLQPSRQGVGIGTIEAQDALQQGAAILRLVASFFPLDEHVSQETRD